MYHLLSKTRQQTVYLKRVSNHTDYKDRLEA